MSESEPDDPDRLTPNIAEAKEDPDEIPHPSSNGKLPGSGDFSHVITIPDDEKKVPIDVMDATIPPVTSDCLKNEPGKTLTVEEAIPLTGVGAFHWCLLLVCGMCGTSAVHEIVSPSYLLPAAACDLSMDLHDKSLLSAMAFIGMIAGTHMWGIMCDRLGRIVVLRLCLLTDALVSIVASLLPNNAPLFIAVRFINGFMISAPPSCSLAYLGEFHGERTRARAMVLFGLFPGGAILTLAGLAYLVLPLHLEVQLPWLEFHSWRLFVFFNGLPSLLTGLVLFWFPESPRYLVSCGRPDLALDVLRQVYAVNSRRPREDFPVAAIVSPTAPSAAPGAQDGAERSGIRSMLLALWEQTTFLFRPPYLKITLMLCIMNFAVLCIGNGLLLWVPELFNRMSLFAETHPDESATVCEVMHSRTQAAPGLNSTTCKPAVLHDSMYVSTGIIGMANLVSCFLGVLFVNLMGKRLLLCVSLAIAGVCGSMVNLTTSPWVLVGVVCGHIGLCTMCVTVVISVFVDNVPTKVRATAVALAMMAGRCGSMSGSYVTGRLLDNSCAEWFWIVSGMITACGLLAFLLPKRGTYAK